MNGEGERDRMEKGMEIRMEEVQNGAELSEICKGNPHW